MAERLKPCPFCGGEAELVELQLAAWCPACKVQLWLTAAEYFEFRPDVEGEIARRWNRRADMHELRAFWPSLDDAIGDGA